MNEDVYPLQTISWNKSIQHLSGLLILKFKNWNIHDNVNNAAQVLVGW
jgi:hypothetical protein